MNATSSMQQNTTIDEYEEFWKQDPSSKRDEEVFRNWTKRFWEPEKLAVIVNGSNLPPIPNFADFGCGRGLSATAFVALLQKILNNADLRISYTGIDGWDAADQIEPTLSVSNLASIKFVKALIYDTQLDANVFDMAACFGVLHHTDQPAETLREIARTLKSGGLLFLHCNANLPLLRACNENGFRKYLSERIGDERDTVIEDLTTLGAAISSINEEVIIQSTISSLGIPPGKYKMIELLNYYVFKLYYNPLLSFDRNVHMNKDWWFPPIVNGYSRNQLVDWIHSASMEINYFESPTPSSFSIVARKVGSPLV